MGESLGSTENCLTDWENQGGVIRYIGELILSTTDLCVCRGNVICSV